MLDRIDIHIEVPRVDYEKLSSDRLGELSAEIRKRVQAVRDIQNRRFANSQSTYIVCNADMRVAEVRKFCKLDEAGDSLVRAAMSQMNLSARAYHRVLKLARTIADLAGERPDPGRARGRGVAIQIEGDARHDVMGHMNFF
jgi:magnesium chelatase family protein